MLSMKINAFLIQIDSGEVYFDKVLIKPNRLNIENEFRYFILSSAWKRVWL